VSTYKLQHFADRPLVYFDNIAFMADIDTDEDLCLCGKALNLKSAAGYFNRNGAGKGHSSGSAIRPILGCQVTARACLKAPSTTKPRHSSDVVPGSGTKPNAALAINAWPLLVGCIPSQ
jgi:hypothetical protein